MAGNQLPMPGGEQRDQTKFIVFENFEKMNTQSIRQSLSEKELAWLENLQPIARNNFTTVPAPAAAALANIDPGEVISEIFYAALLEVDYLVVFTFAGSGYLINIATGFVNHFAADGTFSPYPDVTTWQASRLLIADSQAGYTSFDGTIFSKQGGVSPNIIVTAGGSGYGAAPPVTITGGSGSGVTAHAVVQNGEVIQVILDNPGTGYKVGDTLTVNFGTSPGSGATATIAMTGDPVSFLQTTFVGDFTAPSSVGPHALSISGGGGSGAAGYVNVINVGGSVREVSGNPVLTSPGSGYTSSPTVTLPGVSGGPAPTFIVGFGANQSVASITLGAGGTGYTAPPSVLFVPPDGNGSGASAVTTLSGTSVATVTLTPSPVASLFIAVQGVSSTPGTFALSFSGGGGTGAAGSVTIGNYTNNAGSTAVGVISYIITNAGANYTSAPTVSVSGATFSSSPTILALIASQGSGYDEVPTVTLGSGSGAAASAHVWPFINSMLPGAAFTTLAVFQGRVWLGGGNQLTWSGTGASFGNVAYDDFDAADASGSLIISDADLIHAITALRAFNNYLFIMGDQSVKQIGNISLNQAGDVTLFTILTLSSDQGTIYPKSCISYNRVFMFANTNGIYGVFGSSVQKLSGDMDGIWKLVDFTQVPQGALADINAIHNAVFLVRYKDPLSTTRSIMLTFDAKQWWVLQQGNSLAAIATSASLATGQNSLYGSLTGNDVTLELAQPTVPVPFKIQSALTHHGDAVQGKRAIRAGFSSSLVAGPSSVTMTVDTEVALGANRAMVVPTGFALVGGSNDANNLPINAAGVYLGLTITGTLAGETMTNLIIEFQDSGLWKGK